MFHCQGKVGHFSVSVDTGAQLFLQFFHPAFEPLELPQYLPQRLDHPMAFFHRLRQGRGTVQVQLEIPHTAIVMPLQSLGNTVNGY